MKDVEPEAVRNVLNLESRDHIRIVGTVSKEFTSPPESAECMVVWRPMKRVQGTLTARHRT